jgi:hypothetical protein
MTASVQVYEKLAIPVLRHFSVERRTEMAGSKPQILRVIWEKCFREEVCVQIPFDGKRCVAIEACVRLIEEGGSYYVELQLFGHRVRHGIANVCYPVVEIAIGRLKVCTSDLVIDNGQLKSVKLTVQGCVGADIGPIHVEKCWDLYSGTIIFFRLSTDAHARAFSIDVDKLIVGYNDLVYFEQAGGRDVDPAQVR